MMNREEAIHLAMPRSWCSSSFHTPHKLLITSRRASITGKFILHETGHWRYLFILKHKFVPVCLEVCSHATSPATWPAQNPSNLTGLSSALLLVCYMSQTFQKGTEEASTDPSNFSQTGQFWLVPQSLHRALSRECLWPHCVFWGLKCNRRDNRSWRDKQRAQTLSGVHVCSSCSLLRAHLRLIFSNAVKCLLLRCPAGAGGINKRQRRPWSARAAAVEGHVFQPLGRGWERCPGTSRIPRGCADLLHPGLNGCWSRWPWTSLLHFNRLVRSPHTACLEFRQFLCLHKD